VVRGLVARGVVRGLARGVARVMARGVAGAWLGSWIGVWGPDEQLHHDQTAPTDTSTHTLRICASCAK
jgi:hypothetical protein